MVDQGTMMDGAEASSPEICRMEARKRQVIEAAMRCFRRNGFHATSMAGLAKEAGMSVGHIYHYFENKEAIIAAFIEDDLENFREAMGRLQNADSSFADAMVDQADYGFDDMRNPDNAAIFLEMNAEAARNPKIAALVQDADAVMRSTISGMLKEECGPECSGGDGDTELEARIEIIAAIYEGLTIRAIRNPKIDREATLAAMRIAIARLLAP